MQVLLLSLSPWPRPRLSSCISLRSKITSSWPGGVHCEPPACLPRPQTDANLWKQPTEGLRGKPSWKASHSGNKAAKKLGDGRGRGKGCDLEACCPCVLRGSGAGQVWVPRQGPVSGLPTCNKASSNHKTLSTAMRSRCRGPDPGQALSGWADFVVSRTDASCHGSMQDRCQLCPPHPLKGGSERTVQQQVTTSPCL